MSGYSSWITFLYLRQGNKSDSAARIPMLMNELFFTGVGTASQTLAIITLYNLFDNKKNTYSLETLLSSGAEDADLSDAELSQCRTLIHGVSDQVRAIVILRGNIFAHSGKSDHATVFDKADLTIEDTEKLWEAAFQVLSIVAKPAPPSILDRTKIEEQVLRSNQEIMQLLQTRYDLRSTAKSASSGHQ